VVVTAVACWCALATLCAGAAAADVPQRDLFLEGSNQQVWVAQVVSGNDANGQPGPRTMIRTRAAEGDTAWRPVTHIPARVTAVTRRGPELVVLLEGGGWQLVGDAIRSGSSLPGGAVPIALAGGDESLWAVATPRPPATTRAISAATTTAVTATQPQVEAAPTTAAAATQPTGRPRLYQLDRGGWQDRGELPPSLDLRKSPTSFAVIDDRPWLASPQPDGAVHAFEWVPESGWTDRGAPRLPFAAYDVKILELSDQPVLWGRPAAGAGAVATLMVNGRWSEAKHLATAAQLAPPSDRDVAVALGQLRLVYVDASGRLFEQAFDDGGVPLAEPAEVVLAAPPAPSRIAPIVNLVIMLLLAWVMLVALRRRGRIQEAVRRADQLALAPLLPRLAAGLIDAAPVFVLPIVLAVQTDSVEALERRMNEPMVQLWSLVSIGVYLCYTTGAELLFARSLGKLLFGLRVADLDGNRPRPEAVVARNLLRVIDVTLLFPLAMVIFSPLRQRVGDLAAGTIVIRSVPGPANPERKDEAT
jgi:uncharacterized RDD family membrane protein YckC